MDVSKHLRLAVDEDNHVALLHAGIGAEIPITRGWFLNLGLDYLYPGEPALDEATEKIETETETTRTTPGSCLWFRGARRSRRR